MDDPSGDISNDGCQYVWWQWWRKRIWGGGSGGKSHCPFVGLERLAETIGLIKKKGTEGGGKGEENVNIYYHQQTCSPLQNEVKHLKCIDTFIFSCASCASTVGYCLRYYSPIRWNYFKAPSWGVAQAQGCSAISPTRSAGLPSEHFSSFVRGEVNKIKCGRFQRRSVSSKVCLMKVLLSKKATFSI